MVGITNGPRHEKTNNVVFEPVRHKLACKTTEDDWRLEILDIESRGIALSMYSENKVAYQFRGYCEADLCLCFHTYRLLVFS